MDECQVCLRTGLVVAFVLIGVVLCGKLEFAKEFVGLLRRLGSATVRKAFQYCMRVRLSVIKEVEVTQKSLS